MKNKFRKPVLGLNGKIIFPVFLLLAILGLIALTAIPTLANAAPTISTDKSDYSPEETVVMTGSGFDANVDLMVRVTRPDGSIVKGDGSFTPGSDTVTTNTNGNFTYNYKLDGVQGTYTVDVMLGDSIFATTTFMDTYHLSTINIANPNSVTLSYGTNSATFSITSTWSGGGGSDTATLSIVWSPTTPAGVTSTFNPASITQPVPSSTLKIDITTNTQVGTYTFTVKSGSTTSNQGTLTVSKATPTLSVTNSPRTYSGSPQAATVTGSVTGTVSNVKYNGSGTVPTNAGTYAVTADFAPTDSTNYNSLTGASAGNFIISQAPLTITATGPSKTYGTALTTGTSTTNFTASGMVNGETVTSVTLTPNAAGLSATTAAGAAYTVTPSAATGGNGFSVSNYQITYTAYNGTVVKKPLTVTATGPTKTYGTALTAGTSTTNFTHSGEISGETVTSVTLTPDAAGLSATTAAGAAYVVTPSLATGTGGFLESNYQVTYNAYNGIVAKKPLTVTATGPSKTYGTALTTGTSTANFSAGATGVGSETVTSVTLTPDAAGLSATTAAGQSYTVTPSAATGTGGFLESNYQVTYTAYNGTVAKKPLTVTATGPTKTYGTALTAGTSTTNFTHSGEISGETVTSVTLTPNAAGLSATTAAGASYTVTPSLATGSGGFLESNYQVTYNVYNGTVGKAPLTVTATGPSKTYGTALTTGTSGSNFSHSGEVNGEQVTSVTLTPNAAGLSATTAAGASYTVTPSLATGSGGFLESNYQVTYTAYNGTVATKALTVAIAANNKPWDGNATATLNITGAILDGVVNGDTVSVSSIGYTATFASSAVGNDIAVAVTDLGLTGSSASNYTLTQPTGLKANIMAVLNYKAASHGSISGISPQIVNYGGSGTQVFAVPDSGYSFIKWSDGSTDNPRTDSNVNASISVTANFAVALEITAPSTISDWALTPRGTQPNTQTGTLGVAYNAGWTVAVSANNGGKMTYGSTQLTNVLSAEAQSYNVPLSTGGTIANGTGNQNVTVTFAQTVTWTDQPLATGQYSIIVTFTATATSTAPSGSLSINNDATSTSDPNVTLNLSASDAVGVTGYRIADGTDASGGTTVPVTSTTNYSADVPWTLPTGDGSKTVAVQYTDAAGYWSANYTYSITLNTH